MDLHVFHIWNRAPHLPPHPIPLGHPSHPQPLMAAATVIFGSQKIKSVTASIVSPSICQEVIGPDAMILVF